METIAILILIYVGYQLLQGKKLSDPVIPKREVEYTQEDILIAQHDFEDQIRQAYLPDSDIFSAYIYFELMKPWYQKFESKYRYEKDKIKSIRIDWVKYLNLLEDRARKKYLLSENDDRGKALNYLNDIRNIEAEIDTIENSYAQLAEDSAGVTKLKNMKKEMGDIDLDKLEKILEDKHGVQFSV